MLRAHLRKLRLQRDQKRRAKSIRASAHPLRPPKGGPPLRGKSQSGSIPTLKSKSVEDGWRAGFDALPRCGSPYLSDLERCLGIAPSPGEISLPPSQVLAVFEVMH